MDALLNKWVARMCCFRADAEESFYANDEPRMRHFAALTRQWEYAIEELQKARKDADRLSA